MNRRTPIDCGGLIAWSMQRWICQSMLDRDTSRSRALVTRRYMEARYGDRALSSAEVQALKEAVSRISSTRVEQARKPPPRPHV